MERRSFLKLLGFGAGGLVAGKAISKETQEKILENLEEPKPEEPKPPTVTTTGNNHCLSIKEPVEKLSDLPSRAEEGTVILVEENDRLYVASDNKWMQIRGSDVKAGF